MGGAPSYQAPVKVALPEPEKPKGRWFSILDEIGPHNPTIIEIQRATAGYFGLSQIEFLSDRRSYDVVIPRQIAMYLCKIYTTRSLPEIGRRFGGKDHTTVLHAVRKIERCIPKDWKIAHSVAHIEGML